jgi:hypothetical protein
MNCLKDCSFSAGVLKEKSTKMNEPTSMPVTLSKFSTSDFSVTKYTYWKYIFKLPLKILYMCHWLYITNCMYRLFFEEMVFSWWTYLLLWWNLAKQHHDHKCLSVCFTYLHCALLCFIEPSSTSQFTPWSQMFASSVQLHPVALCFVSFFI